MEWRVKLYWPIKAQETTLVNSNNQSQLWILENFRRRIWKFSDCRDGRKNIQRLNICIFGLLLSNKMTQFYFREEIWCLQVKRNNIQNCWNFAGNSWINLIQLIFTSRLFGHDIFQCYSLFWRQLKDKIKYESSDRCVIPYMNI